MCRKAIREEARWRIEAHGLLLGMGRNVLLLPQRLLQAGMGPLAGYAHDATRSGVDDHALIVDDPVLVLVYRGTG